MGAFPCHERLCMIVLYTSWLNENEFRVMSFFTCFVYLKKIYMLVWFMVLNATFKRVVRTTFDIYVFISTNQYWCFKHHKPNQPVDHFQINAPWYRWKIKQQSLTQFNGTNQNWRNSRLIFDSYLLYQYRDHHMIYSRPV